MRGLATGSADRGVSVGGDAWEGEAVTARILLGDVRARLRDLPDGCVQTCVTSPPYWGLRDYGHAGQLGLEATPDAYVASMVDVFREVRRHGREFIGCELNPVYAALAKQRIEGDATLLNRVEIDGATA